jgi:hypothetical protein
VYIPATAKVNLFLRQQPVYPSIRLKALTGANVDEVSYGRYSLKDIEMTVPILAKCKSVEAIKLGDSKWSPEESRAMVGVINQFPNIERLSLSAKCEASTLTRLRRLNELKELKLNRSQPYLRDCLKTIVGLKNLTSLGVSDWSLPISDLGIVAACPNLEKLMIGRLTGSHDQFSTLAGLARLQQLDMPSLRYRPDLAADLSLLKSLKSLRFGMTSEWNNAIMAQLRHDLPGVQVVPYAAMQGRHKRSGGRHSGRQHGAPRSTDQSAGQESVDQPAPKSTDQTGAD